MKIVLLVPSFREDINTRDYKSVIKTNAANKQIVNNTLITVPDTDHDVADKHYISAIKRAI